MKTRRKKGIMSAFSFILICCFCFTVLAGDGVDSEPNDTSGTAEEISFRGANGVTKVVSAVGKISSSSDEDWYAIELEQGSYSATLTNNDTSSTDDIFGDLPGDYDIYIYGEALDTIAFSNASGTTTEFLTFTVSSLQDGDTFYIRIDGYNGAYSTTEQYKMFLSKGDTAMLLHGFRYKLFPYAFYGRNSSGTEYHTSGVAYSYGSKDTLSMYETKMEEADTYKTTPQDNWDDYSDEHPRPGKYYSEWVGGDTNQTNWAGIDCSGFIYRCAEDSPIDYFVNVDRGAYYVATSHLADSEYSTDTELAYLAIGDMEVKSDSHAMMISRLASTFNDLYVLHADGKPNPESRTIFEEDINDAIRTRDMDEDDLRKLILD